jgi:hypothetical protein
MHCVSVVCACVSVDGSLDCGQERKMIRTLFVYWGGETLHWGWERKMLRTSFV